MSLPIIHLGIGEMIVRREPAVLCTLLGSCISVTIYSPGARLGGLIHYALPDASFAPASTRSPLHFGTQAIPKLVEEVSRLAGEPPALLEAKIVGGAAVIDTLQSVPNIGALNLEIAHQQLGRLGVPIVGEKTGGQRGHKLYFHTDSGQLRVGELKK